MDNKSDDGNEKTPTQGAGGEGGEVGTKRRRRGDAGERNYTCGCGKSYLSYPALYTHIKTKHNGVTPDGTFQPKTNGKSGRGRPKKEDSVNKVKEEDKADNFESGDSLNAHESVISYLRSLGEKLKSDPNQDDDNPLVSDTPDTFDLVTKIPVQILRAEDYGPVLNELVTICKNKNTGSEDTDKETGLKISNLNKIFAVFIYHIGRNLKEDFYPEFVFFLMMYRRALNEIGWLIKTEVTGQSFPDAQKRIEYCAVNNGEYAPDICNDFITDKWGEYLPLYNTTSFRMIGVDTDSMKNAVFLTQHFCNWLNQQKYTNSRLQINDENDI